MILPQIYLDETCGVRPGPNQASFNNIIYTAWYMIARKEQGTFNQADMTALLKHLDLNETEDGLYAPKNSHDNITYKMILSEVFDLDRTENMSFFRAIKDIGIFRIWDVIIYGAMFGPKFLRPVFSLLMWIPALQMVQSCYVEEKVRPGMFGGHDARYKWWFSGKTLHREWRDGTIDYKEWKLPDGTIKGTQHMQNDGKHLSVFRLYALKGRFKAFKWASKVCKNILKGRYGDDYTYAIIDRYFTDRKHPVIAMWKGHGDIL